MGARQYDGYGDDCTKELKTGYERRASSGWHAAVPYTYNCA